MNHLFSMARWCGPCAGFLLLVLSTLPSSGASPRRVLMVDPFGPGVAPFGVAMSAFRSTLAREFGERLEFYEVSLDRARFREAESDDPFVAFVKSRVANRPMDLVATVGGPGMDFVVQHHARLFPDTPVVFMAGSPEAIHGGSLEHRALQVTTTLNLGGMVEDILQIQPQTTNIVMILGASALETFTVNEFVFRYLPMGCSPHYHWAVTAVIHLLSLSIQPDRK